ncbi:hypothetical protein Leryth_010173 [Lithospermum erythrorhizon]|nr:hypothetical protein Leryth_010173 [Lithospermum erythrorhizon]
MEFSQGPLQSTTLVAIVNTASGRLLSQQLIHQKGYLYKRYQNLQLLKSTGIEELNLLESKKTLLKEFSLARHAGIDPFSILSLTYISPRALS